MHKKGFDFWDFILAYMGQVIVTSYKLISITTNDKGDILNGIGKNHPPPPPDNHTTHVLIPFPVIFYTPFPNGQDNFVHILNLGYI